MSSKGYHWRRAANWTARKLWQRGDKCKAHLLFREVIKDARLEASNSTTQTKERK